MPVIAYVTSRRLMSKKVRTIRLTSTNGDIHIIFDEICLSKWIIENKFLDEFEARRISKLEASKPLHLVRS